PLSFEVDTERPEVEITKGPEPRSNDVKPTFEGTASENTEVTVHVIEGLTKVARAKTTASRAEERRAGKNKRRQTGNNKFTAYATEMSGIGNLDGKSEPPVSFEVDTEPPEVEITKGPEPRSNDINPTFAGTASENTEVTVHVFEGLTKVAEAKTTAS